MNENAESGAAWCEPLYSKKAAELILYGRALGLSHAEAEDVLQETFVSLMRRSEEPENPAHFCVRAFRNTAFNHKRSLWRRLAREFESHRWFERSEGETAPEREAMRCLAKLPPEQRETIVLKIWHGYTYEAIGELLGISPNTAAGRYRYGLQKLKMCLDGARYEQIELVGRADEGVGDTPPFGPNTPAPLLGF